MRRRLRTRHRLPRGVALPRPPPDGFPMALGQLPPGKPLVERSPPLFDLAPLDEPFDVLPEFPLVPLRLPAVPLLIAVSFEKCRAQLAAFDKSNCAWESDRLTTILLLPAPCCASKQGWYPRPARARPSCATHQRTEGNRCARASRPCAKYGNITRRFHGLAED